MSDSLHSISTLLRFTVTQTVTNTRGFSRNITISVCGIISLSLFSPTPRRYVRLSFGSAASLASSLFLFLSPHQHVLQPNALYTSSARPAIPLSPLLQHVRFLIVLLSPTIFNIQSRTHHLHTLTHTYTHTHDVHKTSRMTFYLSLRCTHLA